MKLLLPLFLTVALLSSCIQTHKPSALKVYNFKSKEEARAHTGAMKESGAISKDVYRRFESKIESWQLPEHSSSKIDEFGILKAYDKEYQNNPVAAIQRKYNQGVISKSEADLQIVKVYRAVRERQAYQAQVRTQQAQTSYSNPQYNQSTVEAARLIADGQVRSAHQSSLGSLSAPRIYQPNNSIPVQRTTNFDVYNSTGTQKIGELRQQPGIATISTSGQSLF